VEHPKFIGDRSALAVMLALRARGYDLLVPFGENTRYDLVIDDGERLSKVQCKTGRIRHGAVVFKACSSYAHHANPKQRFRRYGEAVDYYGVHCPDNGGVYLVPAAEFCDHFEVALRVEPPKNFQRRRIRYGAKYEIARIPLPTAEPGARAGASGSSA
jgi:PD-(D/E)XK endonuclease